MIRKKLSGRGAKELRMSSEDLKRESLLACNESTFA